MKSLGNCLIQSLRSDTTDTEKVTNTRLTSMRLKSMAEFLMRTMCYQPDAGLDGQSGTSVFHHTARELKEGRLKELSKMHWQIYQVGVLLQILLL